MYFLLFKKYVLYYSTTGIILENLFFINEAGNKAMKKFDVFKTIQLALFVLLAGAGLLIILTDQALYRTIANDTRVRALCILLWAALVLSFLFIFMDFSLFSTFKKDFRELDYAVSSDPVSGIANRYSCDGIIEKYLDQPLPRNIGCIMFDLTNIREINRTLGHVRGNELIHDFSGILQASSMNLCFVGRNGGNKFMALFENCTAQKLATFLERVESKVSLYNENSESAPIVYKYGVAYRENEAVQTITDLIALSNHRIYVKEAGKKAPEI